MRKSTRWLLLGGSMGTAAALVAGYGTAIRAWHLRWGATRDELQQPMPFDDLIDQPNYFATRAITIDATVDDVWPIVTDVLTLPPGTIIQRMEPKQWVAFAPPELQAEATWIVGLYPVEGGTRIVSRTRAKFPKRFGAILRYILVDPAQFVIERNWLLSVKARAEAASQQKMQVAELVP